MQVLSAARFSEAQKEELIEPLSNLEQRDIAKSRSIETASIKPRLRLMAEVHAEGNPHRYAEIPPRTLNLVVKQPEGFDEIWLQRIFESEGYETGITRGNGHLLVEVQANGGALQFSAVTLLHKRNGKHLVVQYQISRD
jgi:hypothetical protein